MKKFLLLKLLVVSLFLLPNLAYAQNVSGSLSTLSSGVTDCISTNCAELTLRPNTNSVMINITGTQAGTQVFEFSPDNRTTWRALTALNLVTLSTAASSTSTGTWIASNANFTQIRVRRTVSTSGAAVATLQGTNNSSAITVVLGGGGSTIGSVTQGSASDASANWTVNCVVGCAAATSDPDDASIAAGQTNSNSNALNNVYDGTVWRRLTIGTAGTASAQVLTIQGVASMTPVLTTLSGTNNIATVTAVTGITNALPAGNNNIGDVDVATIAAGNNNIGDVDVASIAAGNNNIGDVDVASVTGNVTVIQGTGTNLHMVCDSGCSSSTAPADNSAFTAGTTSSSPASGFYHATRDNLTDGRIGALAVTIKRSLFTTLDTPLGDSAMDDTLDAVKITNSTAATATSYITVRPSDGTSFLSNSDVTQDVAIGTPAGPATFCKASATAPTDVSATNDAVVCWARLSGAQFIEPSYNGVVATTGNGASGTGVPRVTIASDSTGTSVVTQATGTNLHMVCDSGCSSSAGFADNAAFTYGTTAINPMGGVLDDVSTNTATENSAAIARITPQKGVHTNLRNQAGTEVGTSTTPLQVTLANTGANTNKILVTPDSVALPANQSVNVAQINGVTPLMGAGNTGTGSPRVTIATDQAALAGMGVGATAAAPPANANYIAGITSGATGGLLSGGIPVCDSQAFLDMTTATTTELVALTTSRTIHVCHIRVISNGTTTFTFKRGTGTNCGTGTTSIDNAIELTAQVGFIAGTGFGEVLNGGASANALCVTNSAAVNLHVFVRYAVY